MAQEPMTVVVCPHNWGAWHGFTQRDEKGEVVSRSFRKCGWCGGVQYDGAEEPRVVTGRLEEST